MKYGVKFTPQVIPLVGSKLLPVFRNVSRTQENRYRSLAAARFEPGSLGSILSALTVAPLAPTRVIRVIKGRIELRTTKKKV